jgi:hypothetical protein
MAKSHRTLPAVEMPFTQARVPAPVAHVTIVWLHLTPSTLLTLTSKMTTGSPGFDTHTRFHFPGRHTQKERLPRRSEVFNARDPDKGAAQYGAGAQRTCRLDGDRPHLIGNRSRCTWDWSGLATSVDALRGSVLRALLIAQSWCSRSVGLVR